MGKRLFFVGVGILLISLLLTGCGSPGGNSNPDQNLQGKIANHDFQFVSGYATTVLPIQQYGALFYIK